MENINAHGAKYFHFGGPRLFSAANEPKTAANVTSSEHQGKKNT